MKRLVGTRIVRGIGVERERIVWGLGIEIEDWDKGH